MAELVEGKTKSRVEPAADNVLAQGDNVEQAAAQKLHSDAQEVHRPREVKHNAEQDKNFSAYDTLTKEAFSHTQIANKAAVLVSDYARSGKPLDSQVTVTDESGASRNITVAEHIKELKGVIDKEANTAVGVSDKLKSEIVNQLLSDALVKRNSLGQELGLQPKEINSEKLNELVASTTDASKKEKLEKLLEAQGRVEQVKNMENAQAATRMVYANLKGGGYTDSSAPLVVQENGKIKANQKDVLDAMQLLMEAGRNKDLRNNELYVRAVNQVVPRLETGSGKVEIINESIRKSVEAGSHGDKSEQEKALKLAVEQADKINVGDLAQLMRDPRFVNLQKESVLNELTETITMASMARLKYAEFLTQEGRYGDAQKQALRVKAELPEVMYGMDATGHAKYNESPIVDIGKLDQAVSRSSGFDPQKLNADLAAFQLKLGKLNGETIDDTKDSTSNKEKDNARLTGELQELERNMHGQLAKQKEELADARRGMGEEKERITGELGKLDKEFSITDESRQVKKLALERELDIIKKQEELLKLEEKANNRNENVVRMLEATYDLAREDRSAARANLEAIKKSDPEFWQSNKEVFDNLEKAATDPGWWDTWGRKTAIVLACVAGVAVAWWAGPAIIAAGIAAAGYVGLTGSSATIVGSIGGLTATTAAGATAGAVTMAGGHMIADATGGRRTSQESLLQDMQVGANAGGSSALSFASIGFAGRVAYTVARNGAILNSSQETLTVSQMARTTLNTANSWQGRVAITGGAGIRTGLDYVSGKDDALSWKNYGGNLWNQTLFMLPGAAYAKGMPQLGEVTLGALKGHASYSVGQYLTFEGINQTLAGSSELYQKHQQGPDYTGWKDSTHVLSFMGLDSFDPSTNNYQAGRVKQNFDNNYNYGLTYYSTKLDKGNHAVVHNNKSVLTDAAEQAELHEVP
jgi:hypothetical protein